MPACPSVTLRCAVSKSSKCFPPPHLLSALHLHVSLHLLRLQIQPAPRLAPPSSSSFFPSAVSSSVLSEELARELLLGTRELALRAQSSALFMCQRVLNVKRRKDGQKKGSKTGRLERERIRRPQPHRRDLSCCMYMMWIVISSTRQSAHI